MSLPLHTLAQVEGLGPTPKLLKLLALPEALATELPLNRVAVDLRHPSSGKVLLAALAAADFGAAFGTIDHVPEAREAGLPLIHSLRRGDVAGSGDVVRVESSPGRVGIVHRRGANANTLLLTERCNSLCVMCSQPPRDEDDSWRLAEALDVIPLLDHDIEVLGITGGEPTLLGEGLGRLLEVVRERLPSTRLHILTNGRLFSDPGLVRTVSAGVDAVTWGIPLYAEVARVHDDVVQASGAFDETLEGIHNLAEAGHDVEIRFVAHAMSLPRLPALAEFIWRNLPFSGHVALMGLEPMGYARKNRDRLWVDPADAAATVADAAIYLARRGMPVSIYNVPLCLLPRQAWPLARQSISDWKQDYAAECEGCAVRTACCGFFISADATWRGQRIRPLSAAEMSEASA
ncbi:MULTISPECIES: His-Xaa-Ser system radical SAM maturase HxsC [Roseomonadaceae]|uniref:His-Xaa-Ser system radical SAM maturase HxsC n=1 Tax=Falsiroseomonas oleicola TaxID=2801474 RepID=A0ABS6HBN8_9PROT|nr:His-Xaa-Ser system radical SAM maturase HxsC [Roseomonas oleicola]MBU8546136.1 His-Xaa-Ser system radical SAM maturase HxsC [Roseomonas oleicola]